MTIPGAAVTVPSDLLASFAVGCQLTLERFVLDHVGSRYSVCANCSVAGMMVVWRGENRDEAILPTHAAGESHFYLRYLRPRRSDSTASPERVTLSRIRSGPSLGPGIQSGSTATGHGRLVLAL